MPLKIAGRSIYNHPSVLRYTTAQSMQRSSLLLTGVLLLVLFSFGAADALLVEPFPVQSQEEITASSASSTASAIIEETSSSTMPLPPPEDVPPDEIPVEPVDVAPPPVTEPVAPPAGAVVKKSGVDPQTIAAQLNFTMEETSQKSLLSAVVRDPSLVTTRILLLDGDRAGLLAWIETPDVKQVFLVLKDSLATLFSPEVRDLLDEVQSPPGKAPRNFLTFLDPQLSEERFVFVRIRERLYEFHIAPGKDEAMYRLMEALTN